MLRLDLQTRRKGEILDGHHCVLGRGPLSHKVTSLKEIEEYNKRLIDDYAGDGGFILSVRLPDRGKKEDIQAMLESLREYARY